MGLGEAPDSRPTGTVSVTNPSGSGRVVLLCDHASRYVPAEYGTLGLASSELERHIAWDPGALPVSLMLSRLLDAPLVAAGMSRLIIDCNRPLDAPDLIPEISETTEIPGNRDLTPAERERRVGIAHAPFHAAIDKLLKQRAAARLESWLVSVHSFTPVYRQVARPWQIGILHDDDERLSRPMIEILARVPGLMVGDNQPYSPADRVYYTLARHSRAHRLRSVMIEIRNDEIVAEAGQRRWAERLAAILGDPALNAGHGDGRRVARTA